MKAQFLVLALGFLSAFTPSAGWGTLTYIDHRWQPQVSIPTAVDVEINAPRNLMAVVSESEGSGLPGAMYLYRRSSDEGLIQFLRRYSNAELPGLPRPSSVLFSPDNSHIYVLNEMGQLSSFELLITGDLLPLDMPYASPIGGFHRGSAISPNGEFVVTITAYKGVLNAGGGLTLWRRNTNPTSPDYGSLTFLDTIERGPEVPDGLTYPEDVVFSEDGSYIFVNSISAGGFTNGSAIDILSINQTASPTLQHIQTWRNEDTSAVTGVTLANMNDPGKVLTFDVSVAGNTQTYFVVAGTNTGKLNLFAKLPASPSAPFHPVFSSEEFIAYDQLSVSQDKTRIIGDLGNTLTISDFVPDANPELSFIILRASQFIGSSFATIRYSTFGGTNTKLNIMGAVSGLLNGMGSLDINPNGFGTTFATVTQVLSANDPRGYDKLQGSSGIAANFVQPQVYVASQISNTFVRFVRNADGTLGASTHYTDGSGGNNDLAGASDVLASPGGQFQYVASKEDDAIVVYRLNASSNPVLYQTVKNLNGGVTGLDGVKKIVFSPVRVGETEPRYIFAVSENDSSLVIFRRDINPASATFGQLTYLTEMREGMGGVSGLNTPKHVVSVNSGTPEDAGVLIVVASSPNDSNGGLAVFRFNLVTELLEFRSFKTNLSSNYEELRNTHSLVALRNTDSGAATGYHLYVPASGSGFETKVISASISLDGTLSNTTTLLNDPRYQGVRYVAASTSGRTLIMTGTRTDRVVEFQRNVTTGALTNPTVYENLTNGIIGLTGPVQPITAIVGGFEYVYIPTPGVGGVVVLRLSEVPIENTIFASGFE